MQTLKLQRKILSFAHRDGVSEPSSELTKLVETLGLKIPPHELGDAPQLVALKIAHLGGDLVESHLDSVAVNGAVSEDGQ